jgi:hypothetical protein
MKPGSMWCFEKIEGFSIMPRGGKRPGSGRKKGGTNKVTADVKQAIMEAFSALGGVEYLKHVAITDPKTFCALLGKLIPVKVAGEAEDPPVLRMTIDAPPDETREQWLARTARERGLLAPAIVDPATRAAAAGIPCKICRRSAKGGPA